MQDQAINRALELVKEIITANDLDVIESLSDACYRLACSELRISSGYVRKNTSHLKWKPKATVAPVDDDSWIETGREDD